MLSAVVKFELRPIWLLRETGKGAPNIIIDWPYPFSLSLSLSLSLSVVAHFFIITSGIREQLASCSVAVNVVNLDMTSLRALLY